MSGKPYDTRMYYGTAPCAHEIEIDLDSDDETVDAYIEAGRLEYYDEWFQYLAEE